MIREYVEKALEDRMKVMVGDYIFYREKGQLMIFSTLAETSIPYDDEVEEYLKEKFRDLDLTSV